MVLSGTPIIILREGSRRTQKRDALQSNINAAKVLASTIKSSFGPKGLDKMLIDPSGNIIITNDGATILKKIDVQHPGAKFVIDLAITQDVEVGDGTSSVVLLTGEFLRHAEELLDNKIHPSIIIEGFKLATAKSMELLDNLAFSYDNNQELLFKIAKTSMSSKIIANESDNLVNIVVKAVMNIQRHDSKIEINDIIIKKIEGSSLFQTSLIDGFMLESDSHTKSMTTSIDNPKLLVLNTELDIHKMKIAAKVKIQDTTQLTMTKDYEDNMLNNIAKRILEINPDVILSTKSISDKIRSSLEQQDIFGTCLAPLSETYNL